MIFLETKHTPYIDYSSCSFIFGYNSVHRSHRDQYPCKTRLQETSPEGIEAIMYGEFN